MTFKFRMITTALIALAVIILAGTSASASEAILGDADCDGKISIIDVTCVQKHIAGLHTNSFSIPAADANGDGTININDATLIQRFLAHLETPYSIGLPVSGSTQPTTQPPTDPEGWGLIIFQP